MSNLECDASSPHVRTVANLGLQLHDGMLRMRDLEFRLRTFRPEEPAHAAIVDKIDTLQASIDEAVTELQATVASGSA